MSIRVALNHQTNYNYDQLVSIGPQLVRLRPAPHCRTPVPSYSLNVEPSEHFVNWQQDPYGNFLARFVFPKKTRRLTIEVDLIAEMTVINPFDFFIEETAQKFPFEYEPWLARELRPFLETPAPEDELREFMLQVDRSGQNIVDMLVGLNQQLQQHINYVIRLEPGVQSPAETLRLRQGSCRDTSWLLVQVLRQLGLAARFVSGYLIQLKPDQKALDGPSGTDSDFTDLHAWAEVYLPGAGWIGLDPTSGLAAGEGHLPLACTPDPVSAAPITGAVDPCGVEFSFEMSVARIHEDPRVTKPLADSQWSAVDELGRHIDRQLTEDDVRLTMGGEPTFVSIDDMDGPEWNIAAVGPDKRRLSEELFRRLARRFAPGGLLHFGQGKWYPGESLPRWALSCFWRVDGEPIWNNLELFADPQKDYGFGPEDANRFLQQLATHLEVSTNGIAPVYEDVFHYLWKERRLPVNVDPSDPKLEDPEERARLTKVYEQGLNHPVGFLMPLACQWWQGKSRWLSCHWPTRSERLFLIPGDSPVGLRLPLDSLPWAPDASIPQINEIDPSALRRPLPSHQARRAQAFVAGHRESASLQGISEQTMQRSGDRSDSNGSQSSVPIDPTMIIRTALCVEPRQGILSVFMPPLERLEDYLDLVAAVEQTADELSMPIQIEGYLPPKDYRLNQLKVTPDPGVIEVNTHPAASWRELADMTTDLYEEARLSRLGTNKFDLDGKHTGTGGGNHIVLGGPTPLDSPFLRRPDLLKSLITYWNNHPSLSYLFSGRFIGPTSQAPRLDEGRRDALYEMEIALNLVPPRGEDCPPWLVDRIFRNLLVDLTGNTHRAEFCIDKLYSPDSTSGRLGLVELRAFDMPPHAKMSLTQQLLIRGLVAWFWREPCRQQLVDWESSLHDRYLLPHFVWQDFREVIDDLNQFGFQFDPAWYASHFEFRFPLVGQIDHRGISLELRSAIEPWYVLGEEPGGGSTVRFVDSSVERLQVKMSGYTDSRHVVTACGRRVPLHPTGVPGEAVAAVRYRAWQPASCLHPTIPVHTPLVFDLVDTWQNRSVAGCVYHVSHPAGRNYTTFPVNANEAEARRGARFVAGGHTPGPVAVPVAESNPQFPCTLDLRRIQA